jgi:uncharacterized protein YueI
LNNNNIAFDSLFIGANTIGAAPINSNLRAIDKKTTTIVIPLSEAKMNLLYNTKKTIFKIKFNTSAQPQYIKIYSNYSIDFTLIGDINYKIQLK